MHLCLTMLLIFLCLSFCIILLPSGTLFLLPDKTHLVFFSFTVCWLVINHLSFYLAGNVLFHFHFLETLCVGIEFLVSSYFLLVFRSVLPLFIGLHCCHWKFQSYYCVSAQNCVLLLFFSFYGNRFYNFLPLIISQLFYYIMPSCGFPCIHLLGICSTAWTCGFT